MSFEKDSDADLLGYMAEQGRDEAFAKEAFGEFFARHRVFLFGVVHRAYGRKLGGEDGSAELVLRAFEKAYRWAGKHAAEPKALAGKRDARRWLCRIAENAFKDLLRAQRRRGDAVELTDELLASVPAPSVDDDDVDLSRLPPGARDALAQSLAALKPEDRESIEMSLPWYNSRTGQFAFAPGEAEKLATSLGLEVDTLRQRRHRAMTRLKAAVLGRVQERETQRGDVG